MVTQERGGMTPLGGAIPSVEETTVAASVAPGDALRQAESPAAAAPAGTGLTRTHINGRQVEVLVIGSACAALRRALAELGGRPFVVIADDGELTPAIAAIGRAYALYAEKTAAARARILGDRQKAARRAELTERLLTHLRACTGEIAALSALDNVREAARILAELPEVLRPTTEAAKPHSSAAQEKPAA